MKLLFSSFILCICATTILAQDKLSPEIKKGTTLIYDVSVNGQNFPVSMKIDSISPEYTRLNWSMQDGSGGYVINTKASIENATHGFWGELHAGEDQTMPADQNILFLSKSLWNALQKEQKLTYDDQAYTIKDQPGNSVFKIKDRPVNVLYLENATGSSRLWILNNPSAPLIVKLEGNPMGIDINLQQMD